MTKNGSGNIEWLQKKLENYIQQGANQDLINTLQNANEQENIKQLNDTLENTKQTIIKTLGKKDLLKEVKQEINIENIQKINDGADKIRESITDGFRKLTQ
jgi:hypothetical protein